MTIAEISKSYREKHNLNKTQLGMILGVKDRSAASQVIMRLERGGKPFNEDIINNLINLYMDYKACPTCKGKGHI